MHEPAQEPTLPRRGDLIDGYEVVAEAARGGMAAVFAVRRRGIGGFEKILALKMVLPHLATETDAIERFLDEARIASRIEHPSVVHVLDVGRHHGAPYLVMEFLRGQSLAAVARKAKRMNRVLPLGMRLAVLARAAEGLAAAHQTLGADGQPLGVVHRDVSPQNIHVGYSGEVKVVDFGIAAARGRMVNTRSGEFRGKLAYAAPEQMRKGSEVDARVDVWALGVVAWELLARRRLFRGDDDAQTLLNVIQREIPNLGAMARDVPADACEWVMRCLQRDVSLRPLELDELAAVLDGAAARVGRGRRTDIAKEMQELFAEERAREDERLIAASGDGEALPLQPEPTGGGSLTALSQDPHPRRKRVGCALGAAFVLVAAGAVAAWMARGVHGEAAKPSIASVGHAPSASATQAAKRPLSLKVPKGVRLVLVDGERHDERPVVVLLAPGGRADVQLLTLDGRELSQVVSAADDGSTLSLPAPSATPTASTSKRKPAPSRPPPAPAKPSKKKPSGPLLADPY